MLDTLLGAQSYTRKIIHCPMTGDEPLLKRSPDKDQRLVMISGIYHFKYGVRNSLDKQKHIQQLVFTAFPKT